MYIYVFGRLYSSQITDKIVKGVLTRQTTATLCVINSIFILGGPKSHNYTVTSNYIQLRPASPKTSLET